MIHQLLLGPQLIADPGQVQFTTTGDTNWVVPDGVTSICAVVVGGGGAGRSDASGTDSGGAGGGLSYKNNIAVTPGETLVVRVGAGGEGVSANQDGQAGGDSYIQRGSTFLLGATGGGGGVGYDPNNVAYTPTAGYSSTQFISGGGNPYYDAASGGGNGGTSGRLGNNGRAGGGGGAGGYSGNGGRGGTNFYDPNNQLTNINEYARPGNGGGGGGGYYGTEAGAGGGGVGLIQEGTSGAAGTSTLSTKSGRGGSGGNNGNPGSNTAPGAGGLYGGGGGGDDTNASLGDGRQGGARIIWGSGRSYPNNSADV